MAFCTSCGKQIADDAKFCPFCGAASQAAQTPVTPAAPAVPEAPQAPQAPEGYAAPQAPQAPVAPQGYAAPQAPQGYAAPQAPVAPQGYAAPQAPVAPQGYAAPQAPQGYAAPQGYYAPQYPPVGTVPVKKSNPLKIIIPVVAVVAVVAVVLILVLGGGGGYEKAVQRMVDMQNGDLSDLEDMLPQVVWQELAEDEGYDSASDYIKEMKELYEMYAEYEDGVTYSYTIDEDKEISEAELRDLKNELNSRYSGIAKDAITECRWLKVTLIWREDGEKEEETGYLGVVKISGDWYVLRADSDGEVNARFAMG